MREPLVTPPTQRVSASLFNRTRGLAEIANISTCTPVAPRPDMGKQITLTHRVLPNIRTPDTITANRACLDYPPESRGFAHASRRATGELGAQTPSPQPPSGKLPGPDPGRPDDWCPRVDQGDGPLVPPWGCLRYALRRSGERERPPWSDRAQL